jgi:hypothetical protein
MEFPFLPYAGTSGHSGTDTSERMARYLDLAGVTATSQRTVWTSVAMGRENGATVAELRQDLPGLHHGRISGALTVLHRSGLLARLQDTRGRCKIYVLPKYAGERGTEPALKKREFAHESCPMCGCKGGTR